ncbi:MAG: DNA-binding transcriptional LysR family regulator [Janthinobacterium sp.]|jgi:DNA-binding transcriptional LysR family regulator
MNLHRLDLFSLSLFNLIARTGSISKGAELAGLAVGAASKRIADLEEAVFTKLFARHSRGVTLTAAGLAMQRHAQLILGDVDHLAADLSNYANGIIGVVRMWANTSAITQFLPCDLKAFAIDNPSIRVDLEEEDSSEVVLATCDGRADFGIFADRTPISGLHVMNYRRDQLVLVVPSGHALSGRRQVRFEEVIAYDIVSLPARTSLAKRLQAEADALGQSLKLRIQVRSFDAMCKMVAAGMGVAILPRDAVQPLVRAIDLRLITLNEDWADRQLLIGMRDPSAVPRAARLLIEHLCESAKHK